MLVEVKPVDRKKWHGKSGKESFSQPQGFEVLYDAEIGKYATGLTPEEAEKYGKLLGADLSDIFDHDRPHPFWGSQAGKIKLPNQTVIFDTSKPSDFVKVKNMKASKMVANSQKELDEGLWPDAEFVIYSEQEQVEIKASKIQKKNKCIKMLSSLTSEQQKDIAQILSQKSFKGLTQDFLDVEIDKLIADDPDEFLRIANMDKKETYIRAAILEAVHRNVMQKEGVSYYYMGDKVASDYEDTVKYFLDPQNQKIKVAILEKIT